MDEGFQIFGANENGRPADLDELIKHLSEQIMNGNFDAEQAFQLFKDVIHPTPGENCHDVLALWCGAMWAFGHGEICSHVRAMWLVNMPWGIGFSLGVEKGYEFEALSDQQQGAIIRALCIVLQIGGMNARVGDEGQILLSRDGSNEVVDEITAESIISQFMTEVDLELGPDAPEPKPKKPTLRKYVNDQFDRWMPSKKENRNE